MPVRREYSPAQEAILYGSPAAPDAFSIPRKCQMDCECKLLTGHQQLVGTRSADCEKLRIGLVVAACCLLVAVCRLLRIWSAAQEPLFE